MLDNTVVTKPKQQARGLDIDSCMGVLSAKWYNIESTGVAASMRLAVKNIDTFNASWTPVQAQTHAVMSSVRKSLSASYQYS